MPASSLPKLRLTVGTTVLTATLHDSPTARDFAALLPLTLELKDYARTEKVSYLPRKLTTKGAPDGYTPTIGDLTYYAPWGNLALFYEDFGYSSGLVLLGKMDAGMEAFWGRDLPDSTVRLELLPLQPPAARAGVGP